MDRTDFFTIAGFIFLVLFVLFGSLALTTHVIEYLYEAAVCVALFVYCIVWRNKSKSGKTNGLIKNETSVIL